MFLEFCVLGSGSAGNATVFRTPRGAFLLDAGLGPRTTAKRLADAPVTVEQLAAICLTHLDRDHFNPSWVATILKYSIRVYCHHERIDDLLAIVAAMQPRASLAALRALVVPFATQEPFSPLPADELQLQPIAFPHDQHGSHGFLVTTPDFRVGYATDLGRVPDGLITLFRGVHVLALESNYDPEMQENSDRPYFLKQRITGGAGHLSNPQAFAAVRAILDDTERAHGSDGLPRHIVLLHRSRECNCPELLRRLFQRDGRIKPVLTLADQHHATPWLRLRHPEVAIAGAQLPLAW